MNNLEKTCLTQYAKYEKVYGVWLRAQCEANDADHDVWDCIQSRPSSAAYSDEYIEQWENSTLVPAQKLAEELKAEADAKKAVAENALAAFLESARNGGLRRSKSRWRAIDKWAGTEYYLGHCTEEDEYELEAAFWRKHKRAYSRAAKKLGSRLAARAAYKAWICPHW